MEKITNHNDIVRLKSQPRNSDSLDTRYTRNTRTRALARHTYSLSFSLSLSILLPSEPFLLHSISILVRIPSSLIFARLFNSPLLVLSAFSTFSIPVSRLGCFSLPGIPPLLSLSLSLPPSLPLTRVCLARSRYRSPRRVRESRDRATFLSQSLAQSGFVATYRCTRDR